uniref:Uncharacterized protein n=1 Tax=Glossina austeni TaxID=7395 RepID=A0A1A9VGS0_GLOAU
MKPYFTHIAHRNNYLSRNLMRWLLLRYHVKDQSRSITIMVVSKRPLSTLHASVSSSMRSMKASGSLLPVKLSHHLLTTSMTGLLPAAVGKTSRTLHIYAIALKDNLVEGSTNRLRLISTSKPYLFRKSAPIIGLEPLGIKNIKGNWRRKFRSLILEPVKATDKFLGIYFDALKIKQRKCKQQETTTLSVYIL